MRSCIVSISEIMKNPSYNLSAKYWCDTKVSEESSDKGINVNVNIEDKEVTTCE